MVIFYESRVELVVNVFMRDRDSKYFMTVLLPLFASDLAVIDFNVIIDALPGPFYCFYRAVMIVFLLLLPFMKYFFKADDISYSYDKILLTFPKNYHPSTSILLLFNLLKYDAYHSLYFSMIFCICLDTKFYKY